MTFRPGLWPTLAAIAGIAVLLVLGTWQVQRLQWKDALIVERDARLAAPPVSLPAAAKDWRDWNFRQVTVEGLFRHDLEQLFGVRAVQNRAGHHLLTPLVRADGTALLIDRGWVPTEQAHPAARPDGQIEGHARVSGIARYRAADRVGWFTPDNRPDAGLWYSYDLAALSEAIGLDLLPIVVEADATPNPGGLPLGGRRPTALANNHLSYAITWYGLAVGLLAVYIAFSLRRESETP